MATDPLTAAQRGCRVLRALGCERRVVYAMVAEVQNWRSWGMLEEDDLWALAIRTVWQAGAKPPAYLRTRVRWAIQGAFDTERRLHGWRRPYGAPWEPPGRRLTEREARAA